MEVTVHASAALTHGPAIKLWYLCRALSDKGCANLDITKAAQVLRVSVRTVYRYLENKTLFREVLFPGSDRKSATVYYSALKRVVTHDHLGAIFALDVKELYKLREISVQAMQLQLQQQCAWLAYQQTKVKTEDVATLIDPSAIRSGVLHDSGVSLFVSETFKPYGGSQHTTARRLGISQRTVCRALSKVEKRRIFQHRPEFCREHQEALFTDYEEGTSTASRYWRFAGRTYKALPSLYFLALELKGSRYNRRRIAASFAKGNIPRS